MATVTTKDDEKGNRQSCEAHVEFELVAGTNINVVGFGPTKAEALKNADARIRELEDEFHEETVEATSEIKSEIAGLL